MSAQRAEAVWRNDISVALHFGHDQIALERYRHLHAPLERATLSRSPDVRRYAAALFENSIVEAHTDVQNGVPYAYRQLLRMARSHAARFLWLPSMRTKMPAGHHVELSDPLYYQREDLLTQMDLLLEDMPIGNVYVWITHPLAQLVRESNPESDTTDDIPIEELPNGAALTNLLAFYGVSAFDLAVHIMRYRHYAGLLIGAYPFDS